MRYLKEVKKCSGVLVVSVNDDTSVRQLKGEGRPINKINYRVEILASLDFVDYVLVYSELDVVNYLDVLKPEIYVKGADYNLETMNQTERRTVEDYKGHIVFLQKTENMSTTSLIKKIKE